MQQDVFERAKKGDNKAFDEIIKANQFHVTKIARECKGRNKGMPIEDLVSEGNIGLIKAIERFDHSQGKNFITYASWWIKKFIWASMYEQGRIIKIPTNKTANIIKAINANEKTRQKEHREASLQEICKESGMEMGEAKEAQSITQCLRYDDIIKKGNDNGKEGQGFLDWFANEESPSPDQAVNDGAIKEGTLLMLRSINQDEIDVITLSFGLNGQQGIEKISEMLNKPAEKVNQIKKNGLEKLKQIYKQAPV